MDQANLKNLYVDTKTWEQQAPAVATSIIPTYLCPSSTGPNIEANPILAAYPVGVNLATTNYLLCKGATKEFCFNPSGPTIGVFGINLKSGFRDMTDGSSNTLCVGEGATGGAWKVAAGGAPTVAIPAPAGRVQSGWICPQSMPLAAQGAAGYSTGGNWGTTVYRINQNPIIQTVYNDAALTDNCAPSTTDFTSNFRSQHVGGAQFLLGDGSVWFISENIDATTYNNLGGKADGNVVGEF